MRILVVGSGGREHALCWTLAASPLTEALYCAPGNAGIAEEATCVAIAADDIDGLLRFARDERIDFVVVGPEGPLCAGLVDRLEAAGIKAFGPSAGAAMLEGSKGFMKDLCAKYGIPTAAYRRFTDADAAKAYIREQGAPDRGQGRRPRGRQGRRRWRESVEEALAAVDAAMVDGAFGAAGHELVVEEFMTGEEASCFALVDGRDFVMLAERPGPQGGRRRRHRPQHRRHGRLFAGAGRDAAPRERWWPRASSARPSTPWPRKAGPIRACSMPGS